MCSHRLVLITALVLVSACAPSEDGSNSDGTWVGMITTEGDVTTVINESGSVWGGTARLVEALSSGTQEKPVKLVELEVFRIRVPRTFSEAVERTEVIAVVKMMRRTYGVQVVPGSETEVPVTHYTAEVLEALKASDVRQHDRIEILRQGGVITRAGTSEKHYDPSFPDYVVGGEYVVFLKWDEPHKAYYPLGGPELTYELDRSGQRVISPSRSGLLAPSEADTPLTFLAMLRALVGGDEVGTIMVKRYRLVLPGEEGS